MQVSWLRAALKQVALTCAAVMVSPFVGVYTVSAGVCGAERVLPAWTQVLSLLPGYCGVYLRAAFFRMVLDRCGPEAAIGFGTTFSDPRVSVGKHVYIGLFCSIGYVTLEDDVLVSSHVSIMNGGRQHGTERLDIPVREQPGCWPHVRIGRDSWIGERAVVMADVGAHCIVAAGAVVTRAVPDYAIVAGVPAKVVGDRRGDVRRDGPDEGSPTVSTSLSRS